MTVEHLNIQNIPAITWGEISPKAYLYLHGQGGNKEEAAVFASIANHYGWQVLILFSNQNRPYSFTTSNTDNSLSRKVVDCFAKTLNHLF